MIYVALGELAVIVIVVAALAGLLRSQQRAHARREDLLLNQMLHLAGKTWTPPPADDHTPPAAVEVVEYTFSPEQYA